MVLCKSIGPPETVGDTSPTSGRTGSQHASATELLDSVIHELEASLRTEGTGVKANGVGGVANRGEKKETEARKLQNKNVINGSTSALSGLSGVGDQPDGTKLDLRVGRITKVWPHETGDKLYCEEIDVGEGAPRQIASGLVPYFSIDDMKDRRVVVMCNLKARNLKGFKSQGMVMCAAAALGDGKEHVEFIVPPEDVPLGDKLLFDGVSGGPFKPATAAQMEKKKVLERVLPELRTDEEGTVRWRQHALMSSLGPCSAPTVRGGAVR